ncbi:3'-5' exoribonuclease [Rosenbergiella collisarenosi]|uniref:3'-5' exonuclease n=1 Tax=Rosenbergiella collisarenosi TaxID=1544695 RepID=UPI001BDA2EB5|nr:3'-5' exonuclease [Rosenbergiella collisarenosi]MBT0720557.1 3'-5' exoribonuclease [Rosenbergiella collisarenosi]
MKHLMVDIETMGTAPGSPILTIGAVFFEPSTDELGPQFYQVATLRSEMANGAVPDADTIMWWMQQSEEARKALSSNPSHINEVLLALSSFALSTSTTRNIQLWGNGANFDNVLLRDAYRRAQLRPFWNFWNDRDVRTIVELGRQLGYDPKREMPFVGDQHNALDDAIHQAKYVSDIWQKLVPTTSD